MGRIALRSENWESQFESEIGGHFVLFQRRSTVGLSVVTRIMVGQNHPLEPIYGIEILLVRSKW